MQELNILFGFEESKFQRGIERTLQGLGYEVNIMCKYSKNAISDFLKKNTQFNCVVLKEMVGHNAYTDDELAELTEERDINVIIVLSGRHKGTSYMETLYAAGITGALFQHGNDTDASVSRVAELIIHKRRRIDARKYYGILEKPNIKLDKISDGKLSDLMHALEDVSYGANIGERFKQICTTLTVQQVVEFLKKLPMETRKNLETYDDFWQVIAALQDRGVTIKSARYVEGIRNFSRRAKVNAANKSQITDQKLNEEYIPSYKKKEHVSNPVGYTENQRPTAEDEFEEQYAMSEYENELYDDREIEDITPAKPSNDIVEEVQDDFPPAPVGDWKALKKWQKEKTKYEKNKVKQKAIADKKAAREKLRQEKYTDSIEVENNHKFKEESTSSPKKPKKAKKKERSSDFWIRMGILIAIILFVIVLIVVMLGVNSMTRNNALEKAQQEQVLTDQMNDIAEIRNGAIENTQGVEPLTTAVFDGEQLLGINAMDIINTDTNMLYHVVNLDGSIFTFEGGGATSTEIDVNSMYYCKMLSSGRFAFYQQ